MNEHMEPIASLGTLTIFRITGMTQDPPRPPRSRVVAYAIGFSEKKVVRIERKHIHLLVGVLTADQSRVEELEDFDKIVQNN